MLELINVSKKAGGEVHLEGVNMTLEKGSLNVLLGATRAGKTSLMRLMAGLDRPSEGDIRMNGVSVLGVPVQRRKVAMVYQQFINYPSLSVYENIASPLRVAGMGRAAIDEKVRKAAALLHLTDHLAKTPLELSGGQQQRTALARAIVRDAELVLLDEPLANLDYKLREELRAELPRLFAATGAIFVYATTEPGEALMLGGKSAALHQGRLRQFGPTLSVYHHPHDLITAEIFSDPPLNKLSAVKQGTVFLVEGLPPIPVRHQVLADGPYTLGVRAHHLFLDPLENGVRIDGKVVLSEITGSESFVHVDVARVRLAALARGVRPFEAGAPVSLSLDPDRLFAFDDTGRLVAAPRAA